MRPTDTTIRCGSVWTYRCGLQPDCHIADADRLAALPTRAFGSGDGDNLNFASEARRHRNGIAEFSKSLQMALYGLADVLLRFVERPASCHAARQVRNVCGPVGLRLFEYHGILHVHFLCSKAADLSIALRLPVGTSSLVLPGTVTTCGFNLCLT